ncbi:hypothetical protein ACFL67_01890 [candidate division KSB1 bacterium]
MDVLDAKKTITPLRFIFWGMVLFFFDHTIRTDPPVMKFDIISDLAGAVLIVYGLWKINGLDFQGKHKFYLKFALGTGFLLIFDAFQGHFILPPEKYIMYFAIKHSVVYLFQVIAFVFIASTLAWLCRETFSQITQKIWKVIKYSYLIVHLPYLLSLLIGTITVLIAGVDVSEMNVDPESIFETEKEETLTKALIYAIEVIRFIPILAVYFVTSIVRLPSVIYTFSG